MERWTSLKMRETWLTIAPNDNAVKPCVPFAVRTRGRNGSSGDSCMAWAIGIVFTTPDCRANQISFSPEDGRQFSFTAVSGMLMGAITANLRSRDSNIGFPSSKPTSCAIGNRQTDSAGSVGPYARYGSAKHCVPSVLPASSSGFWMGLNPKLGRTYRG